MQTLKNTALTIAILTIASFIYATTCKCIPQNKPTQHNPTPTVSHNIHTLQYYDKQFSKSPIDDNLFKRIYGKSYGKGCAIPLTDLRYLHLPYYTTDGKTAIGEMICHKDIADDLIDIFRQLFHAKYPIERMRLIDDYGADDEKSMTANNTSCFNFRPVAGSRTLSKHSRGKAIDLNPLYNPCVRRHKNGTHTISPKAARQYADRSKHFKYKISHDDIAYKLFTAHGFRWGGDWHSLKDYQHFEK